MAFIADYILDLMLAEFDANADRIDICTQEPTTFTEATSTYSKGSKTSFTVGSPADRSPNGRKVATMTVTDGSVSGTGTVTHWGITKASGSTRMATGSLAASQAVTSGNTFTLASFDIGVPDAA